MFGIYPLSVAGTPFGLAVGPEDNYEKTQLALRDLRGESKTLFPRNYLIYTKEWEAKMLSNDKLKGDSATMADIAITAGVSQGLAYRYFDSKDVVLIIARSTSRDLQSEYRLLFSRFKVHIKCRAFRTRINTYRSVMP